MNRKLFTRIICIAAATIALAGCRATLSPTLGDKGVYLPYLKNTPNECYYLDDFMPVPDGLVAGKNGSLDIRYYNYKTATYKEWQLKEIILSFYSKDGRCWSLFEEYYVAE